MKAATWMFGALGAVIVGIGFGIPLMAVGLIYAIVWLLRPLVIQLAMALAVAAPIFATGLVVYGVLKLDWSPFLVPVAVGVLVVETIAIESFHGRNQQ